MGQVVTLRRRASIQRGAQATRAKPVRVIHERNCSVGRTVGILSDTWAFLVLRESYFAATRFETFQSALGIPRATLTQRLRMLTTQGLLRRVQYSQRPEALRIPPHRHGDRPLPGDDGVCSPSATNG